MNIVQTNLKWNGKLSLTNKPTVVIVHHALKRNCTIHDVHRWHLDRGWVGCGYHAFIAKDGTIYEGRPFTAQGAHTTGLNAKSLGVCLEGCYQEHGNETERAVPETQLQALVDFVRSVNLPAEPHSKHAPKLCPGNYFPWDEFQRRLKQPILAPQAGTLVDKFDQITNLLQELQRELGLSK